MSDILKCFGEILMREVRDRTIQEFDMRTSGKMKDESSQKLFEDIQQMNNKQLNYSYYTSS